MKQKKRVLFALERGPLTQWDTFHWRPAIMRLGAVIFNLREDGYTIETDTVETKGGARVASYVLVRKPGDPDSVDRRKHHAEGLF